MSISQQNRATIAAAPMRTAMEHIVIDDTCRMAMSDAFNDLGNPYTQTREFAASVMPGIMRIGAEALIKIQDFATDPDSPGVVLIENLPTDPQLPPTPVDGGLSLYNRSFIGEAVAYGLGKLIGEPIGYKTEKDGDILHNLIPEPGAETTQSNRGSKVFLNFHNDCVYDQSLWFHRYNADFLVLYGHRGDPKGQAETLYIDAKTISSLLSEEDVHELRQPHFEMAAPSNFTLLLNNGVKVWSRPGPILSGPEETPEIALAANGVRARTRRAKEALEHLHEVCKYPENRVSVKLGAGQALLINNRKGIHARSIFGPTFGPNERWLLRANVRRDTWSMRHRQTDSWNVYA